MSAAGEMASAERDSGYFRWHPTPSFLAHLFKGVFKQHHREDAPALRRVLSRDGVVFDVGAHAGQYAKLFGAHVPEGQVFAFEPGSYVRSILRVVLWANRCRNVTVVPVGLGSRMGIETLSMPVKRRGSFGYGLSHFGQGDDGRAVVRDIAFSVPLDAMAEALGIARLDLIKADIEGWELRMIEGAAGAIARFRPVMMLELEDKFLRRAGDSLEAAHARLAGLGYVPAVWRDDQFRRAEGGEPTEWWFPEDRLGDLLGRR